jgi:multidrug resistance protein
MAAGLSAKHSALAVVGLAFFTDALVYAMLPPLMPEYARTFGLSQTRLGLLFGIYAGALLLSTLPLGKWTDRRGRRGPFLGGLVGFGAATILFAFAGNYPMLMVARVCQGVAAAATFVAGLALLADHFPAHQRGKAMSAAFAATNLGLFLGPTYAGWMTEVWTVRAAFLAVACLVLLDALARLMLLPEDPPAQRSSTGYLGLLKDGAVRVFAGALGMGAVLGAAVEAVLPLHLARNLGMGAVAIGLAFTSAALASMLISPLVGHWTDRKGAAQPLALGLVLGALLLVLSPMLGNRMEVHAFLFALGGACSLLMSPCGPALARILERRGDTSYGSVFSLLNITFSLGILVGPVLGSVLADWWGLRAAMGILAAGFVLYLAPVAAYRKAGLP